MAILPTLLYNAETWIGITKESEEKLENLQLFFLRLALKVPQGTPKLALRSETGVLSMKLRVWKRKLMFANHLKSLKEGDLAAKIWKEQLTSDWPGLAKEVKKICEDLAIANVTFSNYSNMEDLQQGVQGTGHQGRTESWRN